MHKTLKKTLIFQVYWQAAGCWKDLHKGNEWSAVDVAQLSFNSDNNFYCALSVGDGENKTHQIWSSVCNMRVVWGRLTHPTTALHTAYFHKALSECTHTHSFTCFPDTRTGA